MEIQYMYCLVLGRNSYEEVISVQLCMWLTIKSSKGEQHMRGLAYNRTIHEPY